MGKGKTEKNNKKNDLPNAKKMKQLAKKVVDTMMKEDAFSKWLGIEVLEISTGTAKLKMTVRDEMTNGFNIAHGGIAYSLADSALAFAANSYGIQSLSIETSISHTKKVESGDVLIATTKEVTKNNICLVMKLLRKLVPSIDFTTICQYNVM